MTSAAKLATDKGLAAVGVQQIADAAGVTKGGFFHHFPSKQALVDAVIDEMMGALTVEIERRMADDPIPRGRFTRAYLDMVFEGDSHSELWMPLWASMITEPSMRMTWLTWFNGQLEKHRATDTGVHLEAVRYATDGLWLGDLVGVLPADRAALHQQLLNMTKITS